MSTLQISELEIEKSDVQLQISELSASVESVTETNTLQISRLEMVSNQVAQVPVLLNPTVFPKDTVEPFTLVQLSVEEVSGEFNSINWVQQATGMPEIQFGGANTKMISFLAPATVSGGLVRFSVTATGPGGTGDPLFLSVNVKPQILWTLGNDLKWHPAPSISTV